MGNSNKPRFGTELTRKLGISLSLAAAALVFTTQIGCGLNPFNRHRCTHGGFVNGDCGCAPVNNYAPGQPLEMAPAEMTPIEVPVESQPVDASYPPREIPGYTAGWRAGQSFASRYGMTTPLGSADPLPAVLMEHNQNPEWLEGCRTGINDYIRNRSRQTQTNESHSRDIAGASNISTQRSEPMVWKATPSNDGTPAALMQETLSTPLSNSITLNSSTGGHQNRDSIEAPECLTTPPSMDVNTRDAIVDELTIDSESVILRNRHTLPEEVQPQEQQVVETHPETMVEQSPAAMETPVDTMSNRALADRVEQMFNLSRQAVTPEPLVEWEETGQLDPLEENPGDLLTQSEAPLDTTEVASETGTAETETVETQTAETQTAETQTAETQTAETQAAETETAETEAANPESTFQPEQQQAEVVTQPEIEAEDSTTSQREVVAEQARPTMPIERSVLSDLHPIRQNRSAGTGTALRNSPLRHVPDKTAAPITPQSDIILSATTQQGGMSRSEQLLMPSSQSSPMRNSQYRRPEPLPTPAATQPAAPGAEPRRQFLRNQIPVFRGTQAKPSASPLRRSVVGDQLQRQETESNTQASLTARPLPPLQSGTPGQNASWQGGKSHARILQGGSDSLLILRSAIEVLPAVGPQLDDLIKGEDRSLPISNTPALSPRQANPQLDELFR